MQDHTEVRGQRSESGYQKKMAARYYDYEFIEQPDENLKCIICLEVAREATQHGDCGKLFCRECIEKNGNRPCPNCRAENPHYFKDMRSQRDIRELSVRCDNVQRGCNSVLTAGTLDDHVNKCGYSLVPCPNQCNGWHEDLQLMRKDVHDHLETRCPYRDYECKHCGKKSTYADITEEHYKKCEQLKIVPCPNPCCPSIMEHAKLTEHIKTVCKYTVVACKYKNIGCGIKLIRKDIQEHESSNAAHFQLALDKITDLNLLGSFASIENAVSLHGEQLQTLKGASLTFRLCGYGRMKDRNEAFFSEPFYTNPGGYKMSIKVYPNGDNVHSESSVLSLYLVVLNGPHDDKLQWPFYGKVKFELLNQLTDENHHSFEMHLDSEQHTLVDDFWGYQEFISHSQLHLNSTKNTCYLMDDTLYFRVSVKVKDCKPWLYCTH